MLCGFLTRPSPKTGGSEVTAQARLEAALVAAGMPGPPTAEVAAGRLVDDALLAHDARVCVGYGAMLPMPWFMGYHTTGRDGQQRTHVYPSGCLGLQPDKTAIIQDLAGGNRPADT